MEIKLIVDNLIFYAKSDDINEAIEQIKFQVLEALKKASI